MGGEALSPVKIQCPSVGKYQGREAGVGGCVGKHPHRSRVRVHGIRDSGARKLGKVITFEI
ncbi:hypothetical protein [Plasmodium yoelii yoelii]|jgi:hypothetical protein|uniref:Uncharacterized protein n=1 Tax=Plasmodium yoelii yoelii TaxID=73239 RepID=Q7R7K3_PLAYO|nr:hypothetical protein [Plasmodium yoelii yoelii]